MINLFGIETPDIQYKKPLTALDRAAKQAELIEKRTQKTRERLDQMAQKDLKNLSSFTRPETQAVFVGQNLYIKSNYVVSMPEYCFFDSTTGEVMRNPRTLTDEFIKNQENLKNNDSKGKLSKKAITGLKNSINWLCTAAKKKRVYDKKKDRIFFFKVNFVTLTLPDTKKAITSHELQKKLINPFLTYMRKYHHLKNYVWRLEFQANGKLHVHLVCDTFLHHKDIRNQWNGLLDRNGYLDEFLKKHRHKNPNSTDVHSTRKVKNMAAYLAKYMSKKNSLYELKNKPNFKVNLRKGCAAGPSRQKAWYFQRVNFWNSPLNPRPISGRIWGCSAELSKANKASLHVPSTDCQDVLNCLMSPAIKFKELFAPPPKNTNSGPYQDPAGMQLKKIGEVFLLSTLDWFSRITGPVKEIFDKTRWMLQRAGDTVPIFEM